jgi:SnoaL-like protein
MPWVPEVFTVPAQQRLLEKRRRTELVEVPFFDGLLVGEPDALVASFAGEPELHDPLRGRIRGERAFRAFAADMRAWLEERDVSVEDVTRVVRARRGFEEVVLHLDGADLPFALVADHPSPGGRLRELRLYHSTRLLTGRPATRPPLLQPDPELRLPDVLAAHRRALADGDAEAVVALFEPDGLVREPSGGEHTHQGPDALRAYYERVLADRGGIALEPCTLVDDGRTAALEYNAGWPPQAGLAVHVRGAGGGLAAVRIYDEIFARSSFSAPT